LRKLEALPNNERDMKKAEPIVSDGCGSVFFIFTVKSPENSTFVFFHFNRLKSVGKCVIIITITQLEYFWRKLLWIIRLH
jgi:hypothetical protein